LNSAVRNIIRQQRKSNLGIRAIRIGEASSRRGGGGRIRSFWLSVMKSITMQRLRYKQSIKGIRTGRELSS